MRLLNEATSDNFERVLRKALAEVKQSGQSPIYDVIITRNAAKITEKVYAKGTPKPAQLDSKLVPVFVNIILGQFRLNDRHHKIKQGLDPYHNVWSDIMLSDFHVMYNITDDPALVTILYIGGHAGNPAYNY